ncbi:ground-like domain protein [Dictyocaulus viviparus]|uniref:Ground-like domain protein n=1 Tax=Dictyocaulus viviparus TaxID=29172 RepID=A0A0D8XG96_DICVI|nr:ground-like domain protein [Dictyocaulus viviparus]
MKTAILFALVAASTAFLFPSSGGCGCGGGGGCGGDTSCLPKLQCQKICFNIPSLSIPSPCSSGGGGCGCGGGRKKRAISGDVKCTDPELRKLILGSIRNDVTDSRNNIVSALKEKHGDARFLVSCVQGQAAFKSSADEYCSDGTPQLTCHVARAVDEN